MMGNKDSKIFQNIRLGWRFGVETVGCRYAAHSGFRRSAQRQPHAFYRKTSISPSFYVKVLKEYCII
jgi:hypothetical protein